MLLLLISTHCICIFVKGCSLHLDSVRSEIQVLGFDWITESPESFKKNKKQNDTVLVKKKSTGCNRILDWVNQPGHTRFFFPLFFLKPGPVLAPGQPGSGSICRVGPGFKIMVSSVSYLNW
jgi:hypothetical protein